ncbi:MAG TPA: DUF4783 domain-containing protein [Bacteroidales bacterium]|jgi:hypothetical protein|nr:DUF4783 domain-containing protein [Bacteroidales bacterium]
MLKINRFKNTLLKTLILPLLLAFAPDDIPQGLLDAMKTGNYIQLSRYFSSSIELAIPGKEDIYSNKQAELILKDFFAKHMPSDFTVLHKGGKEGSQYAIGNLITSNGRFRVTILLKLKESKPYIHQLRFEQENAD